MHTRQSSYSHLDDNRKREQELGNVMSQLSSHYPVMKILGYQRIDPKFNTLIGSDTEMLTPYDSERG